MDLRSQSSLLRRRKPKSSTHSTEIIGLVMGIFVGFRCLILKNLVLVCYSLEDGVDLGGNQMMEKG
jgi:hypothetical protein